MSVKSEPYYWLECDRIKADGQMCAVRSTEGDEFTAWGSAEQAKIVAESSEWYVSESNGEHYCPDHSPPESEATD